MPEIMQYCNVVLGDPSAVKIYFNLSSNETDDTKAYKDSMTLLQKMYPNLKHIIFSFRKMVSATNNSIGAYYLTENSFFDSDLMNMESMVDRVGGGDALMAGLIHGINKFKGDPQAAINFAIAAGALKSSVQGDINFVTEQEILSLMQGNTTGRINR